jgi:hypothetical protein
MENSVFTPLTALSNVGHSARIWMRDLSVVPLPSATKVVLIMNICLAVTLAAEIFEDSDATPGLGPAEATKTPLSSTVSSVYSSSTTNTSVDLEIVASRISARPLFAGDRRPPHRQVAVASRDIAEEPPIKLVGTLISDHAAVAILEIAGKQMTRAVGASVGTSQIVRIDPGLIRLQSGNGQISDVHLTRGTRIEPVYQPSPLRNSLLR